MAQRPILWSSNLGAFRSLISLLKFVLAHPLNAGGRWRALLRVLRWQTVSRIAPGAVALPFVDDTFLWCERGMTGATGNYYCGLHEPEEMAFVAHFLRAGDVFLDVGANVGSYTLLASSSGANVVAVEPVPSTFNHLQMNVLLNRFQSNVRLMNIGLADRVGELRFTNSLDTMNHVLADGELGPYVSVPVETVDNVVGFSPPTLIKIDVEGYETAVLAGATATLRNPHLQVVICETNGSGSRFGKSDQDISDVLLSCGLFACSYDPISRVIAPKTTSGLNTIFIRDVAAASLRTKESRQLRLVTGLL